ncbi:helix-turn-helix domain-containing protein [Comamonas sp. GB3 AK4-5]|uniref:helix-turn-helix domain-containing protein n=1 Tax=Comamonas sp. GB3 AK4-5 TaxID=3231487 RepID=UPI00351E57E1
MPRQNTSPSDFPAAIRQQIAQLAQRITAERKRLGATQVQWAEQLGISQPTMARLERGDPAVSMATYVACLTLIHPTLDLTVLLPTADTAAANSAPNPIAITADAESASGIKPIKHSSGSSATTSDPLTAEQQAQVAQQFAAAKAALDAFKSPGF